MLAGSNLPTRLPFFGTATQVATAQRYLDDLEKAICDGVRSVGSGTGEVICLGWRKAGFSGPGDIQETALGGSPHPNGAGHDKLAKAVLKVI